MKRRQFIAAGLASSGSLLLPGCSSEAPPGRYTAEDHALLEAQRQQEAAASGTGPLGPQRYPGYRGLAQLPWFDLDDSGQLFCSDDSVPEAMGTAARSGQLIVEPLAELLPGLGEQLPQLCVVAEDALPKAMIPNLDEIVQREQALTFVTSLPVQAGEAGEADEEVTAVLDIVLVVGLDPRDDQRLVRGAG